MEDMNRRGHGHLVSTPETGEPISDQHVCWGQLTFSHRGKRSQVFCGAHGDVTTDPLVVFNVRSSQWTAVSDRGLG